MKRIAVDIGGTFTDIVYVDEDDADIVVEKVRSTPRDIGQAVLDAVEKIGVDLSSVTLFIHGTTAGINTIVERKGAKVGLITTAGFTDVLEMARGNRKELYDYMWKKPQPLVPRHLRLGISERVDFLGGVIASPDEKEVAEVIRMLRENGVEAVAVCLLHSCANPENEQRVGRIIEEQWPEATLALSHQVAREMREYERTSTTVVNAYIEKAVVDYLSRLRGNLEEAGFIGRLLVLGPGGVLGTDAVKERAIHTLASGPIGGAAGAAYLASLCGIENAVTMDVGGTSFDVSIIRDGVNQEKYQTEILGYPVLMAGMDIRPIGAGGGSIARVDAAGLLTVGPESAGASPGPMAYGLGGTEPTVTDAALVNGLIDPGYFLGGEIRLDAGLAEMGVWCIAEKLGLGLHEAADGILAVARNGMTTATMEILVGQGFDPRDFALISYGGAGGIFAAGLAGDMSISRVVIPASPGVFSARGILTMNLVHTYTRSCGRALSALDIRELEGVYGEMKESALRTLAAEGMSERDVEIVRSLDIAYEGQRYTVETPVPCGKTTGAERIRTEIGDAFHRLYETRYGHRMAAPTVVNSIRLKATGKLKDIPVRETSLGSDITRSAVKKPRKVYLDGGFRDTGIFERGELRCGNAIDGPAIVEEPFHTTVVMPGQRLEVDKLGNLVIHTGGA